MGFLVEELVVTIQRWGWPVVAGEVPDRDNHAVVGVLLGVASCFDDHDLGIDNTNIECCGDARCDGVGGERPVSEQDLDECPDALLVTKMAPCGCEVTIMDLGE